MLTGTALRHQMVLPEQQSIFDYWRSRCKGGAFPSRYDIEPEHIVRHLPTVSLLEVKGTCDLPRFRYRLAGTGFWPLYEDEIQGRYIDELPIGDRREYWNRVLSDMLTKRRASAGVTRSGTPTGGHLAQFWIRMPLSSDGRNIDMILGYDHLVKLSKTAKPEEQNHKIYA
ncbi:MAG: PAS domain-containing protein [Maricaulaceae bacterium]